MAFSAHEVRVLRRALAVALRGGRDSVDFWLLGRAIGEAQDERERLRAFMTAELRRYRAALPGSAATFLSCLRNAVDEVAHIPSAEDLAALRSTLDLPCGERERASRVALLNRCTRLAEADLERRLAARAHRRAAAAAARSTAPDPLDVLIPGRSMPVSRRAPLAIEPTSAPATPAEPEAVPASEPAPEAVPAFPTGPDPTAVECDELSAEAEPTHVEQTPIEIEAPEAEVPEEETPMAEVSEAEPDAPNAVDPDAPDSQPTDAQSTEAPRCDMQPGARTAEQRGPERARETLSPVIPHRRQGRLLGQLPVPEILQAGTG